MKLYRLIIQTIETVATAVISQPCVSASNNAANQAATEPCARSRQQIGSVKTASAKDTAANKLNPIHTGKGSVAGRSTQEINIPGNIPSPPVRVTGVV